MRVLILTGTAGRARPLSAALGQAGHDVVLAAGPSLAAGPAAPPPGGFDLALVGSIRLRSVASRGFGVPPDRVHPIPAGVDPAAWRAPPRAITAARLRFAGEGPLVAYAGSLAPASGVPDVIDALPTLRVHHPGLRAVVAGTGPARVDLLDAVRRRKLYRAVTFTGAVAEGQLAALFGAADVVVVPNRRRLSSSGTPAGVTAIEAAAAGTPVVAADAVEYVEPGVTGLTFPAGRPGDLAGAVSTLLDDPDLAAKLASMARLTVEERHTWPTVAAHLVRRHAAGLTSRLTSPMG